MLTLWGTPHSLYTGKVRSYLIKRGLAYRERLPWQPDLRVRITPQLGAMALPILELEDGGVMQDSSEIIDRLEARFPGHEMTPRTPVQRTVVRLLEAFGGEYLLALAMHYRWTYRDQQEGFLRAEFGRARYGGLDRAARNEAGLKAMGYFSSFLPGLGVNPATIPAMETSYLELMDALDAHFQAYPYLLGGRPSTADFGMMAPLFAHLGRDPVPASLMKRTAPNLFRWVERMNLPGIADGEFPAAPEAYVSGDAIPSTLEALLKVVFSHWTPGLTADVAAYNAWIADEPGRPAGAWVSIDEVRPRIHPTLGEVSYAWRDAIVRRRSAPHAVWAFGRAQETADMIEGVDRRRLDDLLARTGGREMMALRPARSMRHDRGLLVLAEAR